jgi:anaerobic ribonucleoside-triphosphate reductase activating protein
MNFSSIQFPVFKPYKKSAAEIYISGCTNDCDGCCNNQLKDFDYGEDLIYDDVVVYLKRRSDLFDVISILGGDLLCQEEKEAEKFSKILRNSFEDKELWLFTGKELEFCPHWVFNCFDYLKVGKFDINKIQDGFPASTNQRLLKKGLDY